MKVYHCRNCQQDFERKWVPSMKLSNGLALCKCGVFPILNGILIYKNDTKTQTLVDMIKMHTNNEIRSGKQFHRGYMDELSKFVERRIDSEETRDATKEKKKAQYTALLKRLESTIANVVAFQSHINDAKLLLINNLQKAKTGTSTFASAGDGTHKPTKQEGFVAVDKLTNKAVKLVDRLDFSKKNFERNG